MLFNPETTPLHNIGYSAKWGPRSKNTNLFKKSFFVQSLSVIGAHLIATLGPEERLIL
jgi:hypothetical protein